MCSQTSCHMSHTDRGWQSSNFWLRMFSHWLDHKKAIAAGRLAAAPIECNTKHGVAYTKRKCQRCGTGVDNEHHLRFECRHVALVASRSKHRALFDGVRDVREWMAAAYKP